jgi:hypothetical protein
MSWDVRLAGLQHCEEDAEAAIRYAAHGAAMRMASGAEIGVVRF